MHANPTSTAAPSPAPDPATAPAVPRWRLPGRYWWLLWGLAGVALLVLAAVLGWVIWGQVEKGRREAVLAEMRAANWPITSVELGERRQPVDPARNAATALTAAATKVDTRNPLWELADQRLWPAMDPRAVEAAAQVRVADDDEAHAEPSLLRPVDLIDP